jgi:hypothetical protein
MANNLGTQLRNLLSAVESTLTSSPMTATEWWAITRGLRTASDKARKIARLADRMESIDSNADSAPAYNDAVADNR